MSDHRKQRIEILAREDMAPDQRRIHDEIVSGPRGSVPGPLAVWLHSPGLASSAQQLGQFVRYESVLSPRLSELAILVTGRCWGAEYEWWVHRPIAEEAGLSVATIEAIRENRRPDFVLRDERIVYNFTLQLQRDKRVEAATYAEAVDVLGEVGVVDLVGICGYYAFIAMTINAFEISLPEGEVNELGGW
ncbi:MAG: 4-carboxymuconolactone decarboxylase [Halieaceae bacterium]|jgi:4-carboxymuconolactone decarboxylase